MLDRIFFYVKKKSGTSVDLPFFKKFYFPSIYKVELR